MTDNRSEYFHIIRPKYYLTFFLQNYMFTNYHDELNAVFTG